MKKGLISLLVLFSFVTVIAVSSCKKAVESSPVVVNTGQMATIQGLVQAELDLTLTGLESIPAGTSIFFQIAKNDLNPAAPMGEFLLYETTVDGNGNYSIEVPTNTNGVTVTVIPNDFVYNTNYGGGTTVRTVYSEVDHDVFIVYGETKILDITY